MGTRHRWRSGGDPVSANVLSIHIGQPGEGMSYNVNKPLPYPYHVSATNGSVKPGPQTNNEIWRLVGFQPDTDTQHIEVWLKDWLNEPNTAVGLVPVFVNVDGGGMFNLNVPVTKVTDHRVTPTTKKK